jgi:hypothetical protein
MSERTNAEAIEMLLDGMKDSESFMGLCDLFSDDVVVTQDIMFPGKSWNGREEVEGLWKEIEDGFTDYRLPVYETIREGDEKIVLFGHFEATFTGDQYGTDGHGRDIRWQFRDAYYFENGEIVRIDWVNDTLTVALMTGLIEEDPRPVAV